MPFDGLMLAAVCTELNEILAGARIEKIYQPAKNEITLHVGRPRERRRLILSAHPRDARAHLSTEQRENPAQPPLFCMVLRKHLEGGHIKKFRQPGLERVLEIYVDARDELGRPSEKILICEFMGKHSNILLVDPAENIIIDGIKRYSHSVSRYREVLPGKPYIPPPPQEKYNPLSLDEDTFRRILLEASLDSKVQKVLQTNLEGLSTVMSREIVYRAGLPEDLIIDHCGEHEMRVLWQALKSITLPASRGEFNATIITDGTGKPVEFAAFDITMFEDCKRQHGTPSEILDKFFTAVRLLDRFNGEKQSLKTILKREIKRLEKKKELQARSAKEAEKAENYRIYGELLMANLHRLAKGMDEIAVENFYDPEGKAITIPLDRGLSPSENAQAYFKKYTKAKNTRNEALKQAQKSKEELEYLKGVLLAVEQSTTLSNLEEIKQELAEQGYLRNENKKIKNKKQEKPESSPMSFISSDGFTILVGRNNKQNDRLTMKIASDKDIWLHTKDIPGSHVIIKAENSRVPKNTIYEAAVLAAYYSQARHSENVPVDYTRRKNVKKPRGAKPGYVIYEQQRTAVVNPDEKLVNSLAKNRRIDT